VGGGGATVDLEKIFPDKNLPLLLDVNFNYVQGSKTKYRNLSKQRVSSKDDLYFTSRTNSLGYRIGFIVKI